MSLREARSGTCSEGDRRLGAWILLGVVALGTVATTSAQERRRTLRYVTSVRQLGPVAYRDPLGAMSPDGTWLASTYGLHLQVQRVVGGPVRELGTGANRVAALAWFPGSQQLAAREQDMDRTTSDWYRYDVGSGDRQLLWPQRRSFRLADDDGKAALERAELLELAWRADGNRVAGVAQRQGRYELWTYGADGTADSSIDIGWVSSPRWLPDGRLACLVGSRAASRLRLDCLSPSTEPGVEPAAFGGLAVTADGAVLYGSPNERGFLDLWRWHDGKAERLSSFTRDTYAPYVAADGGVLFKVQDYRVSIATVSADGGDSHALTTFQSETPSWDRSGERVAFTFGDWRRAIDDAKYPDIAQHVGVVQFERAEPAAEPDVIVRSSYSEDQGMHWSPNGRWIVLHSHAEGSDDLWLQPADGSAPAHPITSGGSETGWPRWSSDGGWIVYPSDDHHGNRQRLGVLYVVGVDQETGAVTAPQREVRLDGFAGAVAVAEWTPDSKRIVFEAIEGPRDRSLWIVDRAGGRPELIHRFDSEQWFSGIAVSPDFRWIAYIAPGADGRFQLWRVPAIGGTAEQLTYDPTDKTHPAWSPRGDRIAYTVFSYLSQFWLLEP